MGVIVMVRNVIKFINCDNTLAAANPIPIPPMISVVLDLFLSDSWKRLLKAKPEE